jgi:hypothetical protein
MFPPFVEAVRMVVRIKVMNYKEKEAPHMKRVKPKVRGMKKNLAGILLVWNTFSLKKRTISIHQHM